MPAYTIVKVGSNITLKDGDTLEFKTRAELIYKLTTLSNAWFYGPGFWVYVDGVRLIHSSEIEAKPDWFFKPQPYKDFIK